MKLKYYFQISLLKTLIFNFRILPLKDALKMPVILFRNTRIKSLEGDFRIDPPLRHGMIKFGRCDVCGMENSPTVISVKGTCRFKGKATIGSGSVLCVEKGGEFIAGKKLRITGRSTIFCRNRISFGEDVLISWDDLFMDSDHHDIFDRNGSLLNPAGEIAVGSHVWLGCRCTFLKGCSIKDGSVVASGSILNRDFPETDAVIGGSGSGQRILRFGVRWQE